MPVETKIPLAWLAKTSEDVTKKMFQYKLDRSYMRPTQLDIEAQKAILISKRSTCLFYEVGASLFYVKNGIYHLSDGYNGASSGDVDPRVEGCARVVDGVLKEGQGLCRGSHAELNAMGNCPVDPATYDDVRLMVTLHPCYTCAKQIRNRHIKTVYYIWEYGREQFVTDYLTRGEVKVEQYTSVFLQRWIERNGYDPVGLRHHER
jgi:dCMP deaminase